MCAQVTNDDGSPTVVCVGDSAIWCTGTRYEDKTPNRVNIELNGEPLPPVQFRARGGAVIGVRYPFRVRYNHSGGSWSELPRWRESVQWGQQKSRGKPFTAADYKWKLPHPPPRPAFTTTGPIQFNRNAEYLAPGRYDGFIRHDAPDWYDLYNNPPDRGDINQNRWTLVRDIGWHWPRIVDQIAQFPSREAGDPKPSLDVPEDDIDYLDGVPEDEPPYAEDVDLLIVNGGTNDIELGWLNNPNKTGRDGVRRATRQHCYEDVKELLRRARDRFPNAIIAMVGYYPFASDWTSRQKARDFLSSKNILGNLGFIAEAATDNALNFARMQTHYIRKAVAEVMLTDDGPGTVMVARRFGVVNAFDVDPNDDYDGPVPNALAWGYPAATTDDTGRYRTTWGLNVTNEAATCVAKNNRVQSSCAHASIGHPNREGSRETADRIVEEYREYVSLGSREPVDRQSDDGSVRDAMENYDLDPAEGVRNALTHRVVESITVELTTDDDIDGVFNAPGGGGTGAADPRNDVYLELEPARSGNGERFRLETEFNDFQSGSTDQFFIDPMMGKYISGDVGPVPESHGMDSGTWQHQRKLKGNSHDDIPLTGAQWTADPLYLGDIDRIDLVVEDTNPWALEGVEVELNGHITTSVSVDHGGDGLQGDNTITVWRPRA